MLTPDDIIDMGLASSAQEWAEGETIISNNNNKMNLTSNTAFLTLAIGALGGVVAALQAHDFYLAIGLFVFGVAMVVVYEKTPPTTPTV